MFNLRNLKIFFLLLFISFFSVPVFAVDVTVVVPAICGNGVIEGSEECDDGNLINEDECSSICEIEIISSGPPIPPAEAPPAAEPITEEPPAEEPETEIPAEEPPAEEPEIPISAEPAPAEVIPEPSSSELAVSESPPSNNTGATAGTGGGSADTGGSSGGSGRPISICGNGIVEGREQCDDGNNENGDGCSSICRRGTTLESIQESIDDARKNIRDIIKTDDSVVEKTKKVSGAVVEQFSEVIVPVVKEQIKVVVDDPEVEEVTKKVVAPAAVITSAAVVVPSIWSIIFPLLRFLFLQPILVFGKRKRTKWGAVYDSLNKNPIDLAMVRLINKATNQIVQSRVTDKNGRFLFVIDPGEYIIEVNKQGFVFPSKFLQGEKTDGSRLDLYYGGTIIVSNEQTSITPNIPLDPAKVESAPWKFKMKKKFRLIQHVISIVGILATALAAYISPTWYIFVFLVIHLMVYALFFLYARPKKAKGWGIVRQQNTNKPIKKVVARLFSKQYNKLIATEITGSKGQYAFLVGPSDYYVTFHKKGFEEEVLDVTIEKEGDVIKEDVSLKRIDKEIIKENIIRNEEKKEDLVEESSVENQPNNNKKGIEEEEIKTEQDF